MKENEIPLFKPYIPPRDELMPALEEVLYSGWITQGPKVEEFERTFANYIGVQSDRVVMTSSCTAALHMALVLAGAGKYKQDLVISTPWTTEPTNLAILHAGAGIDWADVDPKTGNIDPRKMERLVSRNTKAIMVVHHGGYPAEMWSIRRIAADQGGIPIIEDAAHALGAFCEGRPIGCHSDFACFSFQAIKHLTMVDGGVLVCKDPLKAERARRLRWFGIERQAERCEVDVKEMGWKYNPNDVMAAMGLVQMSHATDVVVEYMVNAKGYHEAFSRLDGVEVPPICGMPTYWFYTILVDDREAVVEELQKSGIHFGPHGRRNDDHTVFTKFKKKLPGLDEHLRRVVHLPCGWWVGNEERERVIKAMRRGAG